MLLLDEMLTYVGLTSEEQVLLQRAWPALEPHSQSVIEHFYERLMIVPGARAVFESKSQMDRHKNSLTSWLEQTIVGPRDEAYLQQRHLIGRVHFEVGLEPRYMHSAMSVMIADLHRIVWAHPDIEDAHQLCDVLTRALMIDLALMNSTYIITRDQQRLAELRRVLVEHLASAVLLVDSVGVVVDCTPASQALLSGRDPHGLPWQQALPSSLLTAADLPEIVERVLGTGQAAELSRVDALDRHFRIHAMPLEHPQASLLIQVEEITEAVTLEARLRDAEVLAKIGALSAAVAHDLRNPLAGILAATQVVADTLEPTSQNRQVMAKVRGEVNRLDVLVSDLLTYARPRPPRAVTVDLAAVATGAIALLVCENAPSVHGTGAAVGDPAQLQRLLLNLLQNSVQAGAGRVDVTVSDGRLLVDDDGPGIDSSDPERIFEAFVTTKSKGTGLGLAISRRSAVEMGGTLTFQESQLGGAAFLLTLPRPGDASGSDTVAGSA